MTNEEQELYDQLVKFKQEYDKLYVIYEELDELIEKGYSGLITNSDVDGLLSSHGEYKKWRNNAKTT